MQLVSRGKADAARLGVGRGRLVGEERLQLVGGLLGCVPDDGVLVELRLVGHGVHLGEHGPVPEMVAVDHGLRVLEAGLGVLVVEEDLAADAVVALGRGVEVPLVVLALVDGVVDHRSGYLDPAHHVGVHGLEGRPVDLRALRRGRVVGDGGEGRELGVRLVLGAVLQLGVGPHAAGGRRERHAQDDEEGREDAAPAPGAAGRRVLGRAAAAGDEAVAWAVRRLEADGGGGGRHGAGVGRDDRAGRCGVTGRGAGIGICGVAGCCDARTSRPPVSPEMPAPTWAPPGTCPGVCPDVGPISPPSLA